MKREIGKIIGAPATQPVAEFQRAPWMRKESTDHIGRWAEFEVKGVVQRLRWVLPGEFWMGSPDTEEGRSDDEQRHRVTHTHGFWLADTACTQALWQAVLGNNPSHFSGDLQRPVEMVSWDMIRQDFLPELNRLVPGLDAGLPTEAQWEFACRAGTQMPFSFGEQISPVQANYDGSDTYVGLTKGAYRKKTVPVKSLPPNAWGLYEMHGNVWEWCADGYGHYGTDDAMDPAGHVDAASRVLRGGSWHGNPKSLRSANRNANPPTTATSMSAFGCVVSPLSNRCTLAH